MSSSAAPSAARASLGDEAERDAFHATLAFLDEYDGDIELQHEDADVDSSGLSDAASWSPAPTTSASEDGPSQSEPDSEATLSPGGSPSASPLKPSQFAAPKKNPTATKRRHNSHVEDPRMSAKTAAEGAYPSRTRRAELEYLRGKVGELEERLRVLKHASRPDHAAAVPRAVQEPTKQEAPWDLAVVDHQQKQHDTTGSESMWEDVAMRQFEQRQQAEIENQRLRSMLESQIKLARGLERLLKRTNADLILPTNQLKRPRLSDDGRADAAAFDDLMGVIDEMYSQMDAVFSDPRFDREDAPLRDIQVSNDGSLGTVVDVFDARNLPFDLRATSDAVWGYFVNTSVSYAHQQVEITDDVIKKHFDFMVEVQRYQSHFRGRLAGRRYFEEDRIVILWVAMIEPEMPNGTSSEGMVVRQKGWTIVKRPNALPPNCDPSAPVARIQSKHVAVPYVYEDVPDHKRRTGTLTNFVLQSVYSHLQTSRKIIENVLIEGAMKK